jgi:hypothetical protein
MVAKAIAKRYRQPRRCQQIDCVRFGIGFGDDVDSERLKQTDVPKSKRKDAGFTAPV